MALPTAKTFEQRITADGTYTFPQLSPGRLHVIEIAGTFGSGTATLGFQSMLPYGAATTTGTLTSDGSAPLSIAAMPFNSMVGIGGTAYPQFGDVTGLTIYIIPVSSDAGHAGWRIESDGSIFTSTAKVASPDLVPTGAWHGTTNPTGWKPTSPATGTPVVAVANALGGFKNSAGNALTATANTALEVRVPASGVLAVTLASSTAPNLKVSAVETK